MKISGFTILKDASRHGYPFLESLHSILPLVDEFVIALGDCSDDTPEILAAINSPKLRVFNSVWDPDLRAGGRVMAVETNKALARCTGDWCFYLQADEVIHEQDLDRIGRAMRRHLHDPRVEGLRFRYHHFRGSFDLRDPIPYRKQVRIVRNGIGIESVGDACGFGVGDPKQGGRKLRVLSTGAWVYHYGWVRPPEVMNQKLRVFQQFYTGEQADCPRQADVESSDTHEYEVARCRPFTGTHPAVMQRRIAEHDWSIPYQHVPSWRNAAWWDGVLSKTVPKLYRRAA